MTGTQSQLQPFGVQRRQKTYIFATSISQRQWTSRSKTTENCHGSGQRENFAQNSATADAPTTAPKYSNIARGSKATRITRPTPDLKKLKTPELTEEPPEPETGSRIKKSRTKADFSSEKAAELLSQLHTTHIEAVLRAEEQSTRTVEEYADSGLRHIELKQDDQPAFPPVGFAFPSFEPLEPPSAWRSPTFVPEGGRI